MLYCLLSWATKVAIGAQAGYSAQLTTVSLGLKGLVGYLGRLKLPLGLKQGIVRS